MSSKIKQLREQRGWTQEHLGELIGQSNSNINKLETGKVELRERTIRKLAEVFEITISELLEEEPRAPIATANWPDYLLQNDVSDFQAEKDHPINKMIDGHDMHLWRVDSLVLDQVGLHPGDIVVTKSDDKSIGEVRTGTLVIAAVTDEASGKTVFVMREFVEPNCLITNSTTYNAAAIRWSPQSQPVPKTGLTVDVNSVIIHSHRDHPIRHS